MKSPSEMNPFVFSVSRIVFFIFGIFDYRGKVSRARTNVVERSPLSRSYSCYSTARAAHRTAYFRRWVTARDVRSPTGPRVSRRRYFLTVNTTHNASGFRSRFSSSSEIRKLVDDDEIREKKIITSVRSYFHDR